MGILIITEQPAPNDTISLSQRDAYHLHTVLRHKSGDRFQCKDAAGNLCVCRLTALTRDGADAVVLSVTHGKPFTPVPLTLIIPLLKNSRTEWILQKGTELGAATFILYDFSRSVVKITGDKKQQNKLERFHHVISDACKQSTRNIEPQLLFAGNDPSALADLIRDCSLRLLPSTEYQGANRPLIDCLSPEIPGSGQNICVMIGPEGGFEDAELQCFISEHAFIPVSMGNLILRSETAAVTVAALCANILTKE